MFGGAPTSEGARTSRGNGRSCPSTRSLADDSNAFGVLLVDRWPMRRVRTRGAARLMALSWPAVRWVNHRQPAVVLSAAAPKVGPGRGRKAEAHTPETADTQQPVMSGESSAAFKRQMRPKSLGELVTAPGIERHRTVQHQARSRGQDPESVLHCTPRTLCGRMFRARRR